MPNLLTNLPTDNRTVLFRRAEELLRAAPNLDAVKTWMTGDGAKADFTVPSTGLLPWLRMTPTSVPMGQVAIDLRRHNFGVYVEIVTPGASYDDFLNLWGAIETAFVKTRDLGPAFGGQGVFDYLRCGRGGEDRHSGLIDLFVEQDNVQRAVDGNRQLVGRYGSGLVMMPFLKQS